MIEPALVAIFITGGSAVVLKFIDGLVKKPKPLVSYPVGDSERQKFNHKTRMLEKENFSYWHEDWYTKCDCSICNPPEVIAPAKRPVEIDNHNRTYIRYVDGMRFSLPNIVPPEAEVQWDYHGHYAVFRWWKPGGQQMAIKVIPTPEIRVGYKESYKNDWDKTSSEMHQIMKKYNDDLTMLIKTKKGWK